MGNIEEKLKLLPDNPGVYVMLDKDGQIIYVGKAKNLKNRVRQYFFNTAKPEKVMAMVSNIADFYYIIAPSEIDALSLENNLIKKHKPRYNILLKDDKTYPYVRVNVKDNFPTFSITRRIKKDGAKYFGPFMGGVNVSGVLELLNTVYGIRPCDKKINVNKTEKPCLNYHIGKCAGVCAGLINKDEYAERVKGAIDFLSGEINDAEKILKDKMLISAQNEQFEIALKCKELLLSLEKIKLKRITSLNKFLSADVIAYRSNGIYSTVNILFVRNGRMLGGKNFSFESATFTEGEALREFIMQYYKHEADVPEEIISSEPVDVELLCDYLKTVYNKSVYFVTPDRGVKKQLLEMAEVNAKEHLEIAVDRIKHKDDMTVKACEKLKQILGLKNYPKRMECYDISNISGVDKVGSMVVFNDGMPDKSQYRRFKIKTFEGADDFRSLQEMLSRRFGRLETDSEKFSKPDLIVIDGGKGQLSSVKEVFDSMGIKDIDLISLAEQEEEIFLPDKPESIKLPKSDYCLKMLIRIRDEAHRFAITYFRSLHGKRSLSSVLDGVEGLGKVKRNLLLDKFKDLSGILDATEEQLLQVEGIGPKLAKNILQTLKEQKR